MLGDASIGGHGHCLIITIFLKPGLLSLGLLIVEATVSLVLHYREAYATFFSFHWTT